MKKILGIIFLSILLSGNISIAEEKLRLSCKDGVLYKAGLNPEPFDDTVERLVDVQNYTYRNLNFEPDEIHYLISNQLIDGENAFSSYSFDSGSAQLSIYNRATGEFGVITAFRFSEDTYQSTKIKLDNINKEIENYKPLKNIFGDDYYTVSNSGTQKQEYKKFEIIKTLINIVNNVNVTNITSATYKCNKI